jgi:hypothetical protein
MTNGADKHYGPSEKKKAGTKKAKPKDVKATLKRKKLLPASLGREKKA